MDAQAEVSTTALKSQCGMLACEPCRRWDPESALCWNEHNDHWVHIQDDVLRHLGPSAACRQTLGALAAEGSL